MPLVAVMVKIKSVPLAFLEPGCHAHMHNQRGDLSVLEETLPDVQLPLDVGLQSQKTVFQEPFMNLFSTAAFCGLGEYEVSLKKNYPITMSFFSF